MSFAYRAPRKPRGKLVYTTMPKLLQDLILNNWREQDMDELLVSLPRDLDGYLPLILRVMCHWHQLGPEFLARHEIDVKVIAKKQALVVPQLAPALLELVARSQYINWNKFAEWVEPANMTPAFISTQILPRQVRLTNEIVSHYALLIVRHQNLRTVLSSPDWSGENLHTIHAKLHGHVDPSQILAWQNVPNVLRGFSGPQDPDLIEWLDAPHPYQEMPLELLAPEYFDVWFQQVPDFFRTSGCSLEFCAKFAEIVGSRPNLAPELVQKHLRYMCKYQHLNEDFVICFRHLNLIWLASAHVHFSPKILRYWKLLNLEALFDANDGVDDTLIELLYCPQAMLRSLGRNNVRVARYFAQNETPVWGVAKFDKASFEPAHVACPVSNVLRLKQISALTYLELFDKYPTRVVAMNLQEQAELLRQVVRLDLLSVEALTPQIVARFLPLVIEAAHFGCLSDDVLRHLMRVYKIDVERLSDMVTRMVQLPGRPTGPMTNDLVDQLAHNILRWQILPPDVLAEFWPLVYAKSKIEGVIWASRWQNVASREFIDMLGAMLWRFVQFGWYTSEFIDMCMDMASELLMARAERFWSLRPFTFTRAQLDILYPDKKDPKQQLSRWELGAPFEPPLDPEMFHVNMVKYYSPKETRQVVDMMDDLGHAEVQDLLKRSNLRDEEYLYLYSMGAAMCVGQTWSDSYEFDRYFQSSDRGVACAELYINHTFGPEFLYANPNAINWRWFFRFSSDVTVELVRDFADPNRGDLDALMQNPNICPRTLEEMRQIWPDLRWPRLHLASFMPVDNWTWQ